MRTVHVGHYRGAMKKEAWQGRDRPNVAEAMYGADRVR